MPILRSRSYTITETAPDPKNTELFLKAGVVSFGRDMKIKAADTWFSKCVRQRDGWTCQKCGKQYEWDKGRGLDCSHVFGRTRRSTRWCKENAVAMCMGCHRWWHSFPAESGRWFADKVGMKKFELLLEKANTVGPKITKSEEKEIAKHYKKEYERMVEEDDNDIQSYQ